MPINNDSNYLNTKLCSKQVNLLYASPTMLTPYIKLGKLQKCKLESLKTVSYFGAKLNFGMLKQLRKILPKITTIQYYGE